MTERYYLAINVYQHSFCITIGKSKINDVVINNEIGARKFIRLNQHLSFGNLTQIVNEVKLTLSKYGLQCDVFLIISKYFYINSIIIFN